MSAPPTLVIRDEQWERMRRARREAYAERVAGALRKCFRSRLRTTSRPELLLRIQGGIDRAASHAITRQRGVFKYICLMIVFGDDFDRDPQHTWAEPILAGDVRHAVLDKADYLFETGRHQHHVLFGRSDVHQAR